jgi:hypothetical protein
MAVNQGGGFFGVLGIIYLVKLIRRRRRGRRLQAAASQRNGQPAQG